MLNDVGLSSQLHVRHLMNVLSLLGPRVLYCAGRFTICHKTEVIKNTLNPVWQSFTIPVRALCNGDYDRSENVVNNSIMQIKTESDLLLLLSLLRNLCKITGPNKKTMDVHRLPIFSD